MKRARSWIQYRRTRAISPSPLCPLRRRGITEPAARGLDDVPRAIIPARIRKTDATNERFSVRINREKERERLSVSTAFPARPALRCALLFLSLTHKKRSHRREVTYGIAYYTGIIPAGPIWDFSASLWSAPSSSSLLSPAPSGSRLCRFSSSRPRETRERVHTCVCARDSPDRNLFLHGVLPLSVSRSPTEEGED